MIVLFRHTCTQHSKCLEIYIWNYNVEIYSLQQNFNFPYVLILLVDVSSAIYTHDWRVLILSTSNPVRKLLFAFMNICTTSFDRTCILWKTWQKCFIKRGTEDFYLFLVSSLFHGVCLVSHKWDGEEFSWLTVVCRDIFKGTFHKKRVISFSRNLKRW